MAPVDLQSQQLHGALDRLFGANPPPPAPTPASEGPVSEELLAVTHRIAGQFLSVIASAARGLLGEARPERAVDQLNQAVASLRRLATAAEDDAHRDLLDELDQALAAFDARDGLVGLPRLRDTLRDWLARYAGFLGPRAGASLDRLVSWDDGEHPLLEALHTIPGIGPKRLRRLYAAGLHDPQRVAGADPEEVAWVSGIPSALAEQVVAVAKQHVASAPQRVITTLGRQLDAFSSLTRELNRIEDPVLRGQAVAALRQMADLVRQWEHTDDVA